MRTSSKIQVLDSYGNVIDAFSSILSSYEPADKDEAVETNSYYGFLDPNGKWYIENVQTTTILYIKGSSNYAANWTGRAGLTYLPFDQVF